jgi:RNA polymerase subunit RPABC4/transcription elongation factor Spt4
VSYTVCRSCGYDTIYSDDLCWFCHDDELTPVEWFGDDGAEIA